MKKLIVKIAFAILRREWEEKHWRPAFSALKDYGLEITVVDGKKPAIYLYGQELNKEEK